MVLAVLFEQFLPSHRGLKKNPKHLLTENDGLVWKKQEERQRKQEDDKRRRARLRLRKKWKNKGLGGGASGGAFDASLLDLGPWEDNHPQGQTAPANTPATIPDHSSNPTPKNSASAATRPKRKRCKASKCLASLAADFDVMTDWLFYAHCVSENKAVPSWIMDCVLASCILGTLMWLILATDGAFATPFLKLLGYDKLSLGHVLFVCVLVEDIPQVVLTFVIEDYYGSMEENQASTTLTNYALINVVASLYDTLIKLAEAFDEREDVVETGRWCKESIRTHPRGSVACVTVVQPPLSPERLEDGGKDSTPRSESGTKSPRRRGKRTRKSFLEEATSIVAEAKLPRICFLSASRNEGSVKLWDTLENPPDRTGDDKCFRTFVVGGDDSHFRRSPFGGRSPSAVSCLVVLESVSHLAERELLRCWPDGTQPETAGGSYFLTGSYGGTVRLWNNATEVCLKSYPTLGVAFGAERIEVTSIAHIRASGMRRQQYFEKQEPASLLAADNEYFVTGHKSGKARLWNLWPGRCLRVFCPQGPGPTVGPFAWRERALPFAKLRNRMANNFRSAYKLHSVCSLEDSKHFATASADRILRLWEIDPPHHNPGGIAGVAIPFGQAATHVAPVPAAGSVCTTPAREFIGHAGAILSVRCLSAGAVLVTGSEDCTARLWSASTGACLRILEGHTGGVTAVDVVDAWTVLTGSRDTTLRVWDALSASCIRTYAGEHTRAVTSVSSLGAGSGHESGHGGAFCSASEDGTVKLWVFSALPHESSVPGRLATKMGGGPTESESFDDEDEDEDDGTLRDLLGVEDGSLSCMACQAEDETSILHDDDCDNDNDYRVPEGENEESHELERGGTDRWPPGQSKSTPFSQSHRSELEVGVHITPPVVSPLFEDEESQELEHGGD